MIILVTQYIIEGAHEMNACNDYRYIIYRETNDPFFSAYPPFIYFQQKMIVDLWTGPGRAGARVKFMSVPRWQCRCELCVANAHIPLLILYVSRESGRRSIRDKEY
jgi:hypothetical protein